MWSVAEQKHGIMESICEIDSSAPDISIYLTVVESRRNSACGCNGLVNKVFIYRSAKRKKVR